MSRSTVSTSPLISSSIAMLQMTGDNDRPELNLTQVGLLGSGTWNTFTTKVVGSSDTVRVKAFDIGTRNV